MIYLLNKLEKEFKYHLTKNPVSDPQQSIDPLRFVGAGLDPLDVLNDKDPKDKEKIRQTLEHPHYSKNDEVVLKPGVNALENDEQAEYLYMIGGENYQEQYAVNGGVGPQVNHWIVECDDKGIELKGDKSPLWRKHRARQMATGHHDQTRLEQQPE
jgi:hypothetical protein